MKIEHEERGKVYILNISGTITIGESSRKFSEFLANVLDEEIRGVVVNMEEIDYVDSTGIGELVGHLSRYQDQKIPLAFLNPKQRILKLLSITGLDKVFPIFDDLETAVSWCERGDSNPHGLSTTRS